MIRGACPAIIGRAPRQRTATGRSQTAVARPTLAWFVLPGQDAAERTKMKTPVFRRGFWLEAPGSVLLLHGECQTTIGAGAFHFRVRDGIGWDHTAMAARESVRCAQLCAASSMGSGCDECLILRAKTYHRGVLSCFREKSSHGRLGACAGMHVNKRLGVIWSSRTDH